MRNFKISLLSSTILPLALAGAYAVPAQAASVTRTASVFTAVPSGTSCQITAGTNTTNSFEILGDIRDFGVSNDVVRAVMTDGNNNEIVRGEAININVGTSVTNILPSLVLPSGTYDLPIRMGWVDVGTNSNNNLIGLTDVPASTISAAGGACASILSNSGANNAPQIDVPQVVNFSATRPPQGGFVVDAGDTEDFEDGQNVTFDWQFISGTASAISSSTVANPTFTIPSENTTQVWRLTVTDTEGLSSTQDVTINWTDIVAAPNQAPTADAGADQTASLSRPASGTSETVLPILDGTESNDPDTGDTLTYSWALISGPVSTFTNVSRGAPNSVVSISEPAMAGTQVWRLTVTDSSGATDTDDVSVVWGPANVAPVANAGLDQALRTTRPGATQTPQPLILDSTLSNDAEGDALTYQWAQVAGPTLTLSTGSSLTDAAPQFEAPNQEATVVFELIVNDGLGDSAADQVEVVYTFFDNEAPTAEAGPAQTIDQATGNVTVTLDGSGTDPENDTLSFAWTQVSGPSVTLSDASAAAPSFSFDMTGRTSPVVLVFSLETNDGQLGSTADEVTITLTPNAIPVAEAGADQAIQAFTAQSVVTLDGSNSSDGDGDGLTYVWTQVSGPSVTLSDANAAAPTFSYDPGANTASQTFVFDLIVNDGRIDSAPDRIEIAVTPNNIPTANPGPAQTQTDYVIGSTIQLDGRGSGDPNGDQLTYSWVQLSGPSVTLDDPTSATPTFTFDPTANGSPSPTGQADFVFGLIVGDGVSQSPQAEVQIALTVNEAPDADAGDNQTLETPADGDVITLDGTGSSDPEGDTLTYSWVQTSGRAITLSDATAQNPTFTYDFVDPLPAEESFTFSLIINDGNQDSEADSVTINVINNQAPTANAGTDLGPINADQLVTLNGGASSDPDNDTLTYAWTQVSGPTVTLSDATAQSPSFTAPDVSNLSTLVFELVVNDGRVSSAPDQVSVSVQPVGSITIVQRVTGSDGTFAYTSDVSALNGSITTQGGAGQLVADRIGTGVFLITADDERDQGFALTDVVCSDGDSTTNVPARTATVNLAPGEDVTCTFDVVNSREAASEAIRVGLTARSQLILASEPDMHRRINRLKKETPHASGARIAGLTVPGSDKLGLNADISDRAVNVSGSLLAANSDGVLKGQLNGATKGGKFDVWAEAQIQDFDFQGADGDFSILYFGADYLVSDNVLIGGLVQVDDFSLNDANEAGYVSGDGFLAGPYATVRLGEKLYVDARAAWGSSDNSVNPLGSFTDDFDTNRALYAGTLTGDWTFKNQLSIRPELSLKHLSESQEEYTDSLGVIIPEQTVNLGELSFGPRVSKPISFGRRWTMTPFGEVKGIYNFGDEARDILQNDTRLRLEGGADWASHNGARIGLSGFTDGVGADDLESYGFRVSLAYTMK